MDRNKPTRKTLTVLAIALLLSGCGTAKEDAYVDTTKRVKRILSQTLNYPESRIVRIQTLSNIGLIPGKNDQKLKEALEAEFKVGMTPREVHPNETVDELVSAISEYRALAGDRKKVAVPDIPEDVAPAENAGSKPESRGKAAE